MALECPKGAPKQCSDATWTVISCFQDGMPSGAVSLHVARAAVLLAVDAGNEVEPLCEAALLRIDVEAISNGAGSINLMTEVCMLFFCCWAALVCFTILFKMHS